MHYSKNRRKPVATAVGALPTGTVTERLSSALAHQTQAPQSDATLQAKVLRLSDDLGVARRLIVTHREYGERIAAANKALTGEVRAQKVRTAEAVNSRCHSEYTKGKLIGAGFASLVFVLVHYLTNVAW